VKDREAKRLYDRERYLARYRDRRAKVCAGCGQSVHQPRHGYAIYCSAGCRWDAWYNRHPETRPHPSTREAIAMPYVGDDLFTRAREITGIWGESDYGNDILGETVLALLEGRDVREALQAYKTQENAYTFHAIHMANMGGLGRDGKGNLVMEYQDLEGG